MSKVFTITEGLENLGALRTGGQGSVYKARRIGPILTAVKLIPTPIIAENDDDRNFRNFKNEVEKLKRVNQEPNPNVVKILSYGVTESGSFPFIEMEYIEGPDLEELLKDPHEPVFTIKETIKVADQLACALRHCHKVGVKHGDIKSNNVKFNIHSGNYVLLDFGLAVMSDEQRRSSMRHAGAIEFMAPEQNEGQMLFQTDIYSFGVILYELLAGRVPFPLNDSGETARNTVRLQHIEATVPNLLELRRQNMPATWSDEKRNTEMHVPQWLLTLIDNCLKKNPEERYANGLALHDAIATNAISGGTNAELKAENETLKQQVEALPPAENYESVEQDGSTVNISRPIFILMILFMTGLSVATAYFAFKARRGPVKEEETVVPKDTATIKVDTPVRYENIDTDSGEDDTQTQSAADTPSPQQEKVPETVPDTSIKPQVDTTLY